MSDLKDLTEGIFMTDATVRVPVPEPPGAQAPPRRVGTVALVGLGALFVIT